MRYFHQPAEYWLDHCTMQDWRDIYARELMELPPIDHWGAVWFKHEPPNEPSPAASASAAGLEAEEWRSDLPDVTE